MINLNMEMPKNCNECPFRGLFYCTLYKAIKGEPLNVSYESEERIRSHKCLLIDKKVGHWITNSNYPDRLICDKCNSQFDMWFWESILMHYCPNCGARMESED